MDLLSRLLEHDRWTTRQVVERCREIPHEEWRRASRLVWHMTANVRIWGDLLAERRVDSPPAEPPTSLDGLLAAWDAAYEEFATAARGVAATVGWDETYLDTLETPPQPRSKGGTIAHVITHNMHHRGELIRLLKRLGVDDVPEGDVLSWEHAAAGGAS